MERLTNKPLLLVRSSKFYCPSSIVWIACLQRNLDIDHLKCYCQYTWNAIDRFGIPPKGFIAKAPFHPISCRTAGWMLPVIAFIEWVTEWFRWISPPDFNFRKSCIFKWWTYSTITTVSVASSNYIKWPGLVALLRIVSHRLDSCTICIANVYWKLLQLFINASYTIGGTTRDLKVKVTGIITLEPEVHLIATVWSSA